MRVALNLLGLPHPEQGGAGMVALTLARGLATVPGVALTVLARPEVAAVLDGLEARVVTAAPRRARVGDAVRSLRAAELFHPHPELAPDLRDADVVHHPLGFAEGPVHEAARVVTAVDVQHLALPANFPRRDRVLRRVRWHRSWREADRLIASTHVAAEEIGRRLGLRHVDVVHAATDRLPAAEPERFRVPTLLYPASPLPHKDHATLLAALIELRREREVRLIFTGPAGHGWEGVRALVAANGLEPAVELRGHVEAARLQAAYGGAAALAFASRYEGFGIPVVEAMAAGCPVVVARGTAPAELAADAARLFTAGDAGSLAAALRAVLDQPAAERQRRVDLGRRRAAGLGAARMVELTMETYERAIAARRTAARGPRRPRSRPGGWSA